MTFKRFNPFNAWKFGTVQGAVSHGNKSSTYLITTIRAHHPSPTLFIPSHFGDFGLQDRTSIEIKVFCNTSTMRQNLWSWCVFGRRHKTCFFQQRKIDIGLHITCGTGITIPVPRPTKVATLFNDEKILNTFFMQPCTNQETAESAAHNDHIHISNNRISSHLFHVGIIEIMGKSICNFNVLLIAVCAHSLVALNAVLLAQLICIDVSGRRHILL